MNRKKKFTIDKASQIITQSIGTPVSIVLHTLFFFGIFSLTLIGWDFSRVLLLLTTILSIEAIYLALFIQMTINKANEIIEDVEESIEDVEADIDDIQAEDEADEKMDKQVSATLNSIQEQLLKIQKAIDQMKPEKPS